jgi:hypothetical protein
MFESQGTTPEFQGNPESGIDQFLNQSTTTELTIDQLKARITELEAENGRIAELERENGENRKLIKWFDKYMEVKNFIQASLDREEWDTDELSNPFWEELAGMLNLDLKLEREITVTVTWNLTVKGKADLSSYDFEASIEPANGQLEFISGESWPDIEVSE